jgi:hypothetical protein
LRVSDEEFRRTPWHVHQFLADVPLHDVWAIRLEGGGPDRHLKSFRAAIERRGRPLPTPVRLLFGFRKALGAVFRLDPAPGPGRLPAVSYVNRLSAAERERSIEPPGGPWGPFRLVYAFEDEALGEIVNRTVHGFSFMGMQPAPGGYLVHWAIYVRPVGALTRPYMALIDPFRRWLVYPPLIRGFERAWTESVAGRSPEHR